MIPYTSCVKQKNNFYEKDYKKKFYVVALVTIIFTKNKHYIPDGCPFLLLEEIEALADELHKLE